MPTGAEETAVASILAAILDKASNLIQGIDVIVSWTKAQEGVKYNSHVFQFVSEDLQKSDEEPVESASLASSNKRGATPAAIPISVSKATVLKPRGEMRSLMVVRVKPKNVGGSGPNEINLGGGVLQFALALREISSSGSTFDNAQVVLLNARGFDTSIGTQAEFEFGGASLRDGQYLLTFNAQINPWGEGFRRIAGGVAVSRHGELRPHGSWATGAGHEPNRGFTNNLPWKDGVGFVVEL